MADKPKPIRSVTCTLLVPASWGGDIAAVSAMKGIRVTLQDQDRRHISQALGRAATLFRKRLKNRRLEQAALDRLVPDPDGHGLRHADLVLEAITENPDVKRALFREVEPKLKAGAILATNTSSLSVTGLGSELSDPSRLVGIHFFNPVARMPLVEIVTTLGILP